MRIGRSAIGFALLVAVAAAGPAAADELMVAGRPGNAAPMTADAIAALPAVTVAVSFETEHGPRHATFEGPLLWTVLDRAGVVDPAKGREQAHQFITITGRDGYTAVLGLGEISPAFESKQVILAERMDGQALGPEHLRVVVPGDAHGGRSVHDVVRLTVGSTNADKVQ